MSKMRSDNKSLSIENFELAEQDGFDLGYANGKKAITSKAAYLLEKGCSKISTPALTEIVRFTDAVSVERIEASKSNWLANESHIWRRQLKSAYHEFRNRSDATVDIFLHLMGYVRITLQKSDRKYRKIVQTEISRLENRVPLFVVNSKASAVHFENHSHGALELDWDSSCQACRYEAGWILGQIETILDGLKSPVFNDEEVHNVLVQLADGSIPFPLAPPIITGWKGQFLDFQLEALSECLSNSKAAMNYLIMALMEFKVHFEIKRLVG
jgi:hypothetical protein